MLTTEKWNDNQAKIIVVCVVELVLTCTMYIMIIYLTVVWELNLTHAAAIINWYVGIAAILMSVMGMKLTKDRISLMMFLSSVAYIAGFGFLTISTPAVLKQKFLFYTALPLITMGVFGHKLMKNLVDEQRVKRDSGQEGSAYLVIVVIIVFIIIPVALFVLDGVKRWSIKFGIPIIFAAVGTLIISTCSIDEEEARGMIPLITWKETKSLLRIIPICIFFIPMGVVSSLGQTYFIQQASHLDHGSGDTTVYLFSFPVLYLGLKLAFKETFKGCMSFEVLSSVTNPPTGIACSMVLATLCCITAAKVEARRLGMVMSNGLIDKPQDTIPMTMGWIYFQFLLLGLADGLSEKCIVRFFSEDVLHCTKKDYRGIPEFTDHAAEEEYYQKN